MASGKKRSRKKKQIRSDESYLVSARALSDLVPKLKKYKRRKTITRYEKSAITRREKQLKNIPFLVPLSKDQAKKLGRKKLFAPGVRAVQLRNVAPDAKIKIKKGGDIEITSGNQHWIYWSLDRDAVRSRVAMREAGKAAFAKQFPIEIVSELTQKAFKQFEVQQVHLWAHAGIVGDAFQDIGAFIRWVNEKWNAGRYMASKELEDGRIYSAPSDPGKWVNGIAILLADPEYVRRRRALEAQQKTQN
jgi:hypothetical protein